jgi:hypothetical protein
MERRSQEGHLVGPEFVARSSPHDDQRRFRQTDRRQGGLIYIDVSAPPPLLPTTRRNGGACPEFHLHPEAPTAPNIRHRESVKKATEARTIREAVGFECDKIKAQLESELAKILFRHSTRIPWRLDCSINDDNETSAPIV